MALSEISSIAPGAILDLGLDLSDPIVIRINEKAVGTGRLIQIGDRVGIQIERWTDETKRAWS
jgi:flagellar motor switch/type III secretory pathway protein FliN